jgi:hypothetical protein
LHHSKRRKKYTTIYLDALIIMERLHLQIDFSFFTLLVRNLE